MRHILKIASGAVALVLATGAAVPLSAADLALVIENSRYQSAASLPPEVRDGVAELVETLNGAGYDVHEGRNRTAQEMFQLLATFQSKLASADRVVIFVAANPVTTGRETWLLGTDAKDPTPVTAALSGPSLGLLLSLALEAKDRSVVIVEAGEDGFASLALLRNGVGPTTVPQGVFLVHGPAGGLGTFIAQTLLAPGVPAAEAVKSMADPLVVGGEAPRALVFGPEARVTPPTPPTPTRPRVDPAEAAEDALGLTQRDRERIQEYLAVLGFDPRGIDGIFGPDTRTAIRRWQRSEAIEDTGYLKEGQLQRLENQAAARARELAAEAELARRAAEQADNAYWQETGAGARESGLRNYLRRFPDGLHAAEAQRRLARIEADQFKATRAEESRDWRDALAANTVAAYRRYLATWPRGAFVAAAEARIEALAATDKDKAQRDRQLDREQALRLSLVTRVSIEQRLNRLGFGAGRPDGTFDAEARTAIRAFQRANGLAATGFMNEPTLARLVALTP